MLNTLNKFKFDHMMVIKEFPRAYEVMGGYMNIYNGCGENCSSSITIL